MHSKINSIQGQAWDQISRTAYGTELRVHEVVAANADEADVLLLSGGQAVLVPELPAVSGTTTLPPWERG